MVCFEVYFIHTFPYQLKALGFSGYNDGFPVVFDVHLSEKRAIQLLTYLQDGGLLESKETESLTVKVLGRGTHAVMSPYGILV